MDDFSSWIGNSVRRHDRVTPRLAAEYQATLAPHLHQPVDDNLCAPGLHWGLAPAMPTMAELGADGAEAKGRFLPPIPLPYRMWAGGAVESFAPLQLGMEVERVSTLTDLKRRDGKSGPLCFVTITHEIHSGGNLLLRERQDLVFRGGRSSASAAAPVAAPAADLVWRVETSAALLFRYSAFIFNAHRIHYDLDFARNEEGYAGLLVHGPLQAALLLNQMATVLGRVPARFDYRCLAPLIAGRGAIVATRGLAATIRDGQGTVTCEATAIP